MTPEESEEYNIRNVDPDGSRRDQEVTMASTPTQVAHPWRAALRTAVQSFLPLVLGLMLAGPEIVDAFADVPTDGAAWATLGGVAVGLSAVAGALARVAAIPAVEKVLIRLGLGTGVEREDPWEVIDNPPEHPAE